MMTLEEAIKHCKDVALSCTNKECALEHFQLLKWLKEYSNMLEKQGEQKPVDKAEPKFKVGDIIKLKDCDGLEWTVEEVLNNGYYTIVCADRDDFIQLDDKWELVGQKPADYEPKFHEGDWIVQGYNILKIKCVGDTHYCFETVGGYVDDMLVSEIDSQFHLWTIQDAKDGDVLSYRDGQWIFIYKEKIDDSSFCYHALYSTIHQDLTINDAGFTLLGDAIIPGTKEQRDLLFQKMKEAGYEWDANKLEPKKIDMQELVKQSPAWSEGDEGYFNSIAHALSVLLVDPSFDEINLEHTAWFQSLKDRMLQQPKQEWSKEDRKMFVNIKACLRNANKDYSREVDWLKSLRPQSQWKPSDEQIKALETALYTNMTRYDERYSVLSEFVAELKKLKGK